jgi:hypothetical protein
MKEKDCLITRLKFLRSRNPEAARSIAEKFGPHLDRLMKVFRKCAAETPRMESVRGTLPFYEQLIQKFAEDYQLEPFQVVLYESRPNPMGEKAKFSFEK